MYKYNEYQVYKYTQELSALNENYRQKIEIAQQKIEKINTKAYINKSLKAQSGLKNPGETMVTLITEERYNTYTKSGSLTNDSSKNNTMNPLSDASLIATMNNYEKWVYLIFKKDIR
jgi:hypothetical protein